MMEQNTVLLLIGKTGSGKSATGNIIFNDSVFESKISSSSVTRVCQTHTGAVNNRRVTLIDTPDFKYSTHTDFDSDSELKRALELCSRGAHVILLILPLSTFTEHEKDFVDWFEQRFGQEALRFTLVLFTRAENISNSQLRALIRRNNELSGFIDRCGWRVCGMNNKDRANRQQVTELMEKAERLVSENRNSCYTLEMMQETERRRQESYSSSYERPSKFKRFLLKAAGVVCAASVGAAIGQYVGGNVHLVTVSTGLAAGLLMWKSLSGFCSSSHVDHSDEQIVLKAEDVLCSASGNVSPVKALAGLAEAAGAFTGNFWRLIWKCQSEICSSKLPSAVRPFLLKIKSVV